MCAMYISGVWLIRRGQPLTADTNKCPRNLFQYMASGQVHVRHFETQTQGKQTTTLSHCTCSYPPKNSTRGEPTKWTSPNAPRPMILTSWKSSAHSRLLVIFCTADSSAGRDGRLGIDMHCTIVWDTAC